MLAATILTLAGAAAGAEPALPVRLSDADPRWRLAVGSKIVAPDLTLAAVATHASAPDRLLFLTAPATVDPDAFVHAITAVFKDFTCGPMRAKDAKRAGCAGRDWSFELANPRGTLDCVLFVFTDAGSRWGILYSKPREAPETADAVFGLLLKYSPPPPGTATLKPFRIREAPVTPFPISIRATWTPAGDRVVAIAVTSVAKDSEAEHKGIQEGDAIVAIDGRKVEDFTAGVGQDDELGRIFLNRHPGDHVTLELRPPGAQRTFTVTLHTLWGDEVDSPFRDFGR